MYCIVPSCKCNEDGGGEEGAFVTIVLFNVVGLGTGDDAVAAKRRDCGESLPGNRSCVPRTPTRSR